MDTQAAFGCRFSLCELVDQNADFAYWLLQVIVNGHNGFIASSTDAKLSRAMLAIVPTQPDHTHSRILTLQAC